MEKIPAIETQPLILDGGNSIRPQKRIFIGLLVATCLILAPLLALLWYVPFVGFTNIHPYLPLILGIVFGAFVILVFSGVFLLILTIMLGRDLFISKRLRGIIVKIVFPLLIGVGRLFGVSKAQVQRSFIEINNQLVLAQKIKTTPDKILLLMPHCLQFHDCPVRITGRVENCKRCGKCHIKGLLEISEKYQVGLAVATGGTIARRIIVERRPKVIIAVACERDLTSGLKDSYPLPVYGILNHRPHGPCYDTEVDLKRVEQAVQVFLPTPESAKPSSEASP
ncbi:DUF116 domain-containing protein [Desulfobacca acetoxidans]|uniref:DUF116 domain-containing protein n=1 Tax=Desulfobacca acetoxidans (strain ATCC 700848 / DSM 11109 / ASRB2) TaxID=880072 RepID=F2NCG2_DESAR|nr:DUF116 domain-containing protein [Desulfobacca acetoxidans]AEB09026.1 protein of unknown function DUF116 [Desulfobacca acetoxidans DSM 11109]HAY22090.1 DUF116 domain-containing protein [Desulfobacterales bacterium]